MECEGLDRKIGSLFAKLGLRACRDGYPQDYAFAGLDNDIRFPDRENLSNVPPSDLIVQP